MGRYWCDRSHASRAFTIKIRVLLHLRTSCLTYCYRYEEQGKYLTKRNTFQDFISCAEYLVCLGLGPGSGSGSYLALRFGAEYLVCLSWSESLTVQLIKFIHSFCCRNAALAQGDLSAKTPSRCDRWTADTRNRPSSLPKVRFRMLFRSMNNLCNPGVLGTKSQI